MRCIVQGAQRRVAVPTPAAPRAAAAPACRRRLPALRAAAAPAVSDGPNEQQLLQQIADKEHQLATMFERRPVPKASEVAALRREITELKAALPQQPGAGPAAGRPARPEDRELAARVLAELNTVFHRTAPGNDDDEEIAHLEAENTALRAEAHALLQHQAKLEGLVEAARAAAAAAAAGEDILKSMRSKLSSGGGGPAGAKA